MRMLRTLFMTVTLLALVFSSCGEDTDTSTVEDAGTTAAATTTAAQSPGEPECDLESASIIPDPSGRPQHIYFYRDT